VEAHALVCVSDSVDCRTLGNLNGGLGKRGHQLPFAPSKFLDFNLRFALMAIPTVSSFHKSWDIELGACC
jgi:hypothetical protein